ncbi:MAG: hypothetical protein ABIO94_06925 [Opitutaceae bacterium]
MSAAAPMLDRRQLRQLTMISIGAIAVFVVFRFLPTGTNLNHMDFRVNASNSIDFCDPLNPQFIPVVAVASPVTMTLQSDTASLQTGRESRFTLTLKTAKGKVIAPEDLVIAHTKLLHLLIVDPTLTDYQHVHPEVVRKTGEWTFAFMPRRDGVYRVFADFTPAATGRGLYASADLTVESAAATAGQTAEAANTANAGAFTPAERNGYRFSLTPATPAIRAGKPVDLKFAIVRADGGAVPMEPVMGAFAHLVAFDEARSGFAHLHPMETDVTQRPDATHPTLNFKITIPREGSYVIWSQVNLGGEEVFVPFRFEVGK